MPTPLRDKTVVLCHYIGEWNSCGLCTEFCWPSIILFRSPWSRWHEQLHQPVLQWAKQWWATSSFFDPSCSWCSATIFQTLHILCCSNRYGDPRSCTCHHHGGHRCAPAQQPQSASLLFGECWRRDVRPLAAHRQLGQRSLQHHGVAHQLQRASAQHQQPHAGLHHGLQLHSARGLHLHLHGLQRPTLLPSTLQQPSSPGHPAARKSQRCGAGAALLTVRGLLPHPEGPGPGQPEATQPSRFD